LADLPLSVALPVAETDELGRYLEDTITIDWQTPAVTDCARGLLAGLPDPSAQTRVARLFHFVRDEIAHSWDLDPSPARVPRAPEGFSADFLRRGIACRASEVLALGHGLCFAKSHLLAALLRFAGHPTGFCYARLADDERPGRFVLHGFVACAWPRTGGWILLDPRGNRVAGSSPDEPGQRGDPSRATRLPREDSDFVAGCTAIVASECRFEPPFSLAYVPDPDRGESLLPFIYKRPAKRIVDFLERVPDQAALRRSLPDSIG
jgi:transglutaminase-like putative cysteine protease